MESKLNNEKIRKLAKALDDAIEKHNVEELVSYFSEDCRIQLPGVTLIGYDGLRKAIRWMFRCLGEITLVPVTIIIEDGTFFEEFVVKAKIDGRSILLRQTEILKYDNNYKVTAIRLYFDRLEFAQAISSNFIDRLLINRVSKASLKGLSK